MLIANTFFVLLYLNYSVASKRQQNVVDSNQNNILSTYNKLISNHSSSFDTDAVVPASENQIKIKTIRRAKSPAKYTKSNLNTTTYKKDELSLEFSTTQPYSEIYEIQSTATIIPEPTTAQRLRSGENAQWARNRKRNQSRQKNVTVSENKIRIKDEKNVFDTSTTNFKVSVTQNNPPVTTSEKTNMSNPLTETMVNNATARKENKEDLLVTTNTPRTFTKRPAEFNPVFKKKRQRDPVVRIISEKNFNFAHSGNYHYSYEGGDGTKVSSQGELKSIESDKPGGAVVGSVFYKDKDGNNFSLSYTADENGYRPQGAHLPTPPPVPPAIARALRYLATKTTEQPVTEALRVDH